MAAVIPQPFLVDIAFQVYYNIIGIYRSTLAWQLGETLLEKGYPPDPLPKPFINFRQSGAMPPDHRKYVEVQEESLRKTFPKRISPTAMQGYCGKSELSSYVW